MIDLTLLATVVPRTVEWSPKVALVMCAYNVLALAIGKFAIQKPNEGPPTVKPEFFGGLSAGAVIACWCFGHILGIGGILGLASMGVL